jgi:hypothetical protein
MFTTGLSNFEPGAFFAQVVNPKLALRSVLWPKRAKNYAKPLVLRNAADDFQVTPSSSGLQLWLPVYRRQVRLLTKSV